MVEAEDCDGELTYFTHAAEIEAIVKETVSDYANPSDRRRRRSDLYPRFRSVVRTCLTEKEPSSQNGRQGLYSMESYCIKHVH